MTCATLVAVGRVFGVPRQPRNGPELRAHSRRGFVMPGGVVDPTDTIDTFLRIVADVRDGRHRDPLGEVADRLLDMRLAVTA